jgi:phosphatidylglycerophosphatase A
LGNVVHLLAFGLGAGCSPKAPGTMGTLVAVGLYLPLALLPPAFYALVLAAVIGLGVWLCDRAARDLGVHDHPGIVWDGIILGFVLFRLFDVWKPWPIGWLDRRVSGGLGIMLDDLVAGVFAALCLQGLALWL